MTLSLTPFLEPRHLNWVQQLIAEELSEPYSIFTYRYFMGGWPHLTFLALDSSLNDRCVGVIVCKYEQSTRSGYIAMLAVRQSHRRKGLGSRLVQAAVLAMRERYDIAEIVLETETSNGSAVKLYENLGFVKERHLHRYYMNGSDAFRLKLWLGPPASDDFDLIDEYEHH